MRRWAALLGAASRAASVQIMLGPPEARRRATNCSTPTGKHGRHCGDASRDGRHAGRSVCAEGRHSRIAAFGQIPVDACICWEETVGAGLRRGKDKRMGSEDKVSLRHPHGYLPPRSRMRRPPGEFTGLPIFRYPRQFSEPVLRHAASWSRRMPAAAAVRLQPLPREAVSVFPPGILRSAPHGGSPLRFPGCHTSIVRPLQRTKELMDLRLDAARTPVPAAEPPSFNLTPEESCPGTTSLAAPNRNLK